MAFVTPTNVTVGSVLTASKYNQEVVDNIDALYGTVKRFAFNERTIDLTNINTGVVSTATEVFTDLSFTSLAATAYLIEFYTPRLVPGNTNDSAIFAHLCTGSGTALGVMAAVSSASHSGTTPILARTFYTPGAGTTTLNIRCTVTGAAGALRAGSGGTSQTSYFPAYLAVYGPPLT